MKRLLIGLAATAVGTALTAAWLRASIPSQSSQKGAGHLSVEALRTEVPGYFSVDLTRINGSPSARSTAFGADVARWTASAPSSRSMQALDASVVAYLRDGTVGRTEKISTLLALARSASTPELRRYLIDCATALQPLEFAGQLIEDYRRSRSTEDKVALLRSIASAFLFASSGNLAPELLASVELIQTFFRLEFAENPDPTLFSELLRTAHTIIPAAEASTILQRANGLANAKDADVGEFYLNALVADKPRQPQLIRQIDELYQSGKLTGAAEFVSKLVVLIDADRDRSIFDPRLLGEMLPLLRRTEPSLPAEVDFGDVVAYAQWARAIVAASGHGAASGEALSTAALLQFAATVEPVKTAAIVTVVARVDAEHALARDALIARLEAALSTQDLSRSQRQLIEEALARLRPR